MIDRVKVLLYIEVHYPLIAIVQILQRLMYRHVTTALRSETIAVVTEDWFVHSAQHLRGSLLHDSVYNGRDAKWSLLTIWFRDIDTSYGGWLVFLVAYR